MNSLSYFVYLVQLVDALTTVMIWCAVVVVVMFGVRAIITAIKGEIAFSNCDDGWKKSCEARRAVWVEWQPSIGKHAAMFLLFIALAAVIPSRQTMLLIAGSELGERLVKSEGVQSVVNPGMDLIRKWVKQEADKIKEKS